MQEQRRAMPGQAYLRRVDMAVGDRMANQRRSVHFEHAALGEEAARAGQQLGAQSAYDLSQYNIFLNYTINASVLFTPAIQRANRDAAEAAGSRRSFCRH